MAIQLPPEALGTAIGVLIWSFLCLACSGLLVWLTWVHHERTAYAALFAYFTGIATIASISQQIRTIVWWRDIKTEQYHYTTVHIKDPEVAVAGASRGVDLVLFYIQLYCYNVQSLLVLAWSVSLAQAIYQVRRFDSISSFTSNAIKLVFILLPVLFISLLRIDAVQNSTITFFILANIIMAVGMTGAMCTLVAILGKYIQSKVKLPSSRFPYASRSTANLTGDDSGYRMSVAERSPYDWWLLTRFGIACVSMSAFQIFVIFFEISSAQGNQQAVLRDSPDLSVEKAQRDLVNFMSGVSAGILAFVVFGTTRVFREYMWEKLVPRFLKRCLRGRKERPYELSLRH